MKHYRIVKETSNHEQDFLIEKDVGTCWVLITSRKSFKEAEKVVAHLLDEPVREVVGEYYD